MNDPIQNYRIAWTKTAGHGARILRIFGNLPAVELPAHIDGYPVTELGDYCFAPSCQLPEQYLIKSQPPNLPSDPELTELCGSYLKSVKLPDSLQKIGNYTFYNCRHLTKLEFASELQTIGSDAFMNCHKLQQLFLRCAPLEKTGLRQILAQIPWNVEVAFMGEDDRIPKYPEAVIFYPEYYEAYDEIAPAHIFGRKIVGEGFRARLCFKDNAIDFMQYDAIFQKACAEESPQTLCRLAFDRLRSPIGLTASKKLQYTDYILAHGEILCQWLVHDRKLDDLLFLFQEKILSMQQLQYALALAAQAGWGEGNAGMLRWKYLQSQTHPRSRYEFEDF